MEKQINYQLFADDMSAENFQASHNRAFWTFNLILAILALLALLGLVITS